MPEQRVVCPKCGHRFAVTKALTAQVEAAIRKDYDSRLRTFKKQSDADLKKRLKKEEARIQKEATKGAKAEARRGMSAELTDLRRGIRKRDKAIREMEERESKLAGKESRLAAREKSLEARVSRKVEAARRKAIEETSEEVEAYFMDRELQFKKTESDLRRKLRDATRRLEQSSQQLQGEVIELELERQLVAAFPSDEILPVPKGKAGADVLQRVISTSGHLAGTIIWESKRTKNWNAKWLSKMKTDQRREKAEIAVLVSSAKPKGLASRFGLTSGVWVCDFAIATALGTALRANLLDVARVKLSGEGRNEKMEILYQYLMSTEFRQRVEAIAEAFAMMEADLEKERQATQKQWAKRETQIRLVAENLAGAIGDIQAIAPAFPKIRRLELLPPAGG
jgi:hypothetical protein